MSKTNVLNQNVQTVELRILFALKEQKQNFVNRDANSYETFKLNEVA